MDLHRKQEVTVGLLVLFGIGIFLAGSLWLRGASFSRRPQIEVMFPNAGTLKRGSPVRVSGVQLGSVESIEFQDVGRVRVRIGLDPRIQPKIDAVAKLSSVGLAADPVIDFNPGSSTEPLPLDRPIQGVVDRGLSELGADLGDRAKETLTGVQELANKQMAADLRATMQSLQRVVSVYANTTAGPTAELTRTLTTLQRLSLRLDSTVAQVDLARTLRKSDTLMSTLTRTTDQLTATSARLDSVFQRLNRGDGTAGKFLTDTLLYSDLRRAVASLQSFVDSLKKNPGKIAIQVKVF